MLSLGELVRCDRLVYLWLNTALIQPAEHPPKDCAGVVPLHREGHRYVVPFFMSPKLTGLCFVTRRRITDFPKSVKKVFLRSGNKLGIHVRTAEQ